MELTEPEKSDIQTALNHYWHYTIKRLEEKDLGIIDERNLKKDKDRFLALINRFRKE
jgi:hypothetical protein